MKTQLSKWIWNLIAMFFFAWFVLAGWLLLDGDISFLVRAVFAASGCLCLQATSVGGSFHPLKQRVHRTYEWLCYKRFHRWVIVVAILGMVACTGVRFLNHMRDFYRNSELFYSIKRGGGAILDYAKNHKGRLPSDIQAVAIYSDGFAGNSRTETHRKAYGRPFLSQSELNDLSVSDIREPESVIVMYSRAVKGDEARVVFFLDGRATTFRNRTEFSKLLREQPSYLANALKQKAKREQSKRNTSIKGKP